MHKKVGKKARIGGKVNNGVIVILIFVSIALLVGWAFMCILKFASADLRLAYKDERSEGEKEWKGEGSVNVLFVGMDQREGEFGYIDALVVVMIDPIDRRMGVFNVNVDTTVSLGPGRSEKLRNLYNRGMLESEEAPIKVLISGVEILLSIKINRYVMISEEGLVELSDSLGGIYVTNSSALEDIDITKEGSSFRLDEGSYRLGGADFLNFFRADDDGQENKFVRQINGLEGFLKRAAGYNVLIRFPAFMNALERNVHTDLSKRELLRVGYEIARIHEINSAFMGHSSLERIETAEGIVYWPIIDILDQDIQAVFGDPRISKEQARVEIFNSTDIRGLATFRARWLRNMGVDVIRTGDTSRVYEKTTIFTKEPDSYLNTINAVKKSFDEDVEIVEDIPDFICTGDIIIVLGRNVDI